MQGVFPKHRHNLLPALCVGLVFAVQLATAEEECSAPPEGIHLPIFRRESAAKGLDKRSAETGAVGLGDFFDVTYNVMVSVGPIITPLVLDTGSSDLWVESTTCDTNCTPNVPLYPAGTSSTFSPSGINVSLLYGDSYTGTHASGPIGQDTVSIAGLGSRGQYLGAIDDTNTSVYETGSAGIFGLGFPVNSNIWNDLCTASTTGSSASKRRKRTGFESHSTYHDLSVPQRRDSSNLAIRKSPDFASSTVLPSGYTTSQLLTSFLTFGPLITRLLLSSSSTTPTLPNPLFAVTLQRETILAGGNIGELSLGSLPPGVQNSSLSWAPVRLYTPQDGGLNTPSDAPDETGYPISWEVPVDAVYIDGVKLPESTLSNVGSVTALLDTGNSLIRGPTDLISDILATIASSSPSTTSSSASSTTTSPLTIPCTSSHNLTFSIGGTLFPVDPRDLLAQAFVDNTRECTINVAPTDPPSPGFMYSWSLGDPFLKGVLAAFYYGNFTHPSQDPPRIGLLSTVPENAGEYLSAAIVAAASTGSNLPAISVAAPTGTLIPASTNAAGVALASQGITGLPFASPTRAAGGTNGNGNGQGGTPSSTKSSARHMIIPLPGWAGVIAAVATLVGIVVS